jgi:hypothetical protein
MSCHDKLWMYLTSLRETWFEQAISSTQSVNAIVTWRRCEKHRECSTLLQLNAASGSFTWWHMSSLTRRLTCILTERILCFHGVDFRKYCEPSSSISEVTGCGMDARTSIPDRSTIFFCHGVHTGCRVLSTAYPIDTRVSSPGNKADAVWAWPPTSI